MPMPRRPIMLIVEHTPTVQDYYRQVLNSGNWRQALVVVPNVLRAKQVLRGAEVGSVVIEAAAYQSGNPGWANRLDRVEENTIKLVEHIRTGGFSGRIIIVTSRVEERELLRSISRLFNLRLTLAAHPSDVPAALRLPARAS